MTTENTSPTLPDTTLQGTTDEAENTNQTSLEGTQEVETDADATTQDSTGTDPAPGEEQEDVKKPTGIERRFKKYQAQISEKERELEYWKQQAMKGTPVQEQIVQTGKPVLADYSNIEQFMEARAIFDRQEIMRDIERTTSVKKVANGYLDKVEQFKKTVPDFQEALAAASDEVVQQDTIEFVQTSDVGPQIAYHLAKNPEELDRLNSLSPIRRIAELGKLEDRLVGKPNVVPLKKVTSAPDKLSDVKGTGTTVIKDPGQATSYAEWKRLDALRSKAR
jgi:hypothetical protein